MKKLFLSLVAAMMAATATFAQNTLVATLTHGSDVTMYYGTYALRDAYNAAVSGDVINLSGGAFQAVNIEKAVKLRGTGIDAANPTYINNTFSVNIPSTDTGRLEVEGIRITSPFSMMGSFSNPYFLKCQIPYVQFYDSPNIKNALFANCKTGFVLNGTSTVQVINCVINGIITYNSASSTLVNCLITPHNGCRLDLLINSHLMNCIINFQQNESYNLPSTSIATNCVSVNNGYNVFVASEANSGNTWGVSYTDMFENAETFELTDAAKKKYLGTDGTQVGIYGGMLPYTSTPSYPQITKMNVANKTTADGKLSVEIAVSAAQ